MNQLISYAQNYEDIMLYRALKGVKKGFYIDIGAAWPDFHSVTKLFYKKGWSGINIEPNPLFYKELESKRNRDINLSCAIGEKGNAKFYILENTGLSTLKKQIYDEHINNGFLGKEHQVQVKSISAIWENHVHKNQNVHFLKWDIEGSEYSAIKGCDWNKYRPWIVVVEATEPNKQKENHYKWESIILKQDYLFAYADGLNRFYVAAEHDEILEHFKYPPNVFDNFIQIDKLILQNDLHNIKNSISWKITSPLRKMKKIVLNFLKNIFLVSEKEDLC